MGFRPPNYQQERADRDRRAGAKKAQKQQAREEKSLKRKAEQEAKAAAAPKEPQS